MTYLTAELGRAITLSVPSRDRITAARLVEKHGFPIPENACIGCGELFEKKDRRRNCGRCCRANRNAWRRA
jgi:hypothetical protein